MLHFQRMQHEQGCDQHTKQKHCLCTAPCHQAAALLPTAEQADANVYLDHLT